MRSLRVKVPASAANLGPGFDSLALALDLHNELVIEVMDANLELQAEGEGEGRLPTDASNRIARAAYRFFRTVGIPPPGMRIRSINHIPLGAGLGSSAAAIVAGLVAADAIAETKMNREQLLEIAWEMEGHADNVAAAIFGGLIIVGQSSGSLLTAQIPIAPMRFAIVTPEIELPTTGMRDTLPRNVTLHDAALNLGRMGLMVEALRHGDFDLLSHAAEDRLHEPYRTPLIPGYSEARSAGLEAGAAAVTLAGAGPGLIAFAPDRHEAIAEAMAIAFRSHDLPVRKFVLDPESQGARLLNTTH
ncbi:MAG: homoserine kinase [Anaerolineae bacterium]|nr:MAG: homoserine kinase [Anaerolineae bacterium]